MSSLAVGFAYLSANWIETSSSMKSSSAPSKYSISNIPNNRIYYLEEFNNIRVFRSIGFEQTWSHMTIFGVLYVPDHDRPIFFVFVAESETNFNLKTYLRNIFIIIEVSSWLNRYINLWRFDATQILAVINSF